VVAAAGGISSGRLEARQFSVSHDYRGDGQGGQITLNNLQQASTNLPAISDVVGQEAKEFPGLVRQMQVSMREVERLVEAMQKTWLLRKYVNQTNPPPANPLSELSVPETKPVKVLHSPRDSANGASSQTEFRRVIRKKTPSGYT
jgi:hypothetical protein